MENRKQPPIQSITRAIAILRCLADNKEMGLAELSREVGLHKSTTAGIVNTLKDEGFVAQSRHDNGKLCLGIKLFCLTVNAKMELSEICMPNLDVLLKETGETVNLAVRDDDHVVYVEKKESPHSMRICTNVGQRLPLYCTAIGKAILAFLPKDEQKTVLNKLVLRKYTNKTITDKTELAKMLDKIFEEGLAYDFEELESGLVCIAAPVFDKREQPIAAISVSGPSMRMNENARLHIGKIVLEQSKEISRTIIQSQICDFGNRTISV